MPLNQQQWAELVGDYHKRIFAFTYQFLGNRSEAEDATQEIFIKAQHSFDSIRDTNAIKSWLYSIARNHCIDRQRWWKRYLNHLQTKELPKSSEDLVQGLSLTLKKLILQLPQRQREVFILRHWHDFSTTETAELLRLSEGTVKSHLKRAVDALKEKLDPSISAQTTENGAPASSSLHEEKQHGL